MKLNYITLMVRDLTKSVTFYQALLSLNIVNEIDLPMGKIKFLSDAKDATMLEFVEIKDSEKVQTSGLVMSFLANEPLENLLDKAKKLGYQPTDILQHGTKPRHFMVQDPDGVTIELSE